MLSLILASIIAAQSPKIDLPKNNTVHTVATAHLDTNWLWTIQDTIRDHLPKTLNANFAFFDQYPDYVFNFEGSFRNMIVNGEPQTDPAKFSSPNVKRVPVGWLATHRHDKTGGNDLYIDCYLFKYDIMVPKGTTTLILPSDPDIKILALASIKTNAPAIDEAMLPYQ